MKKVALASACPKVPARADESQHDYRLELSLGHAAATAAQDMVDRDGATAKED